MAGVRKQLIERVKAVAEKSNLVSVNFLDDRNKILPVDPRTKKTKEKASYVELGFADGTEIKMTFTEFSSMGPSFKFKLGMTEH